VAQQSERPNAICDPNPRLRRHGNLLNRFNVICPVQPFLQKYFRFPLTRLKSISSAALSPKGRIRIVRDAGRDAVDEAASGVKRDGRAG
jgi:hypothetical protein